MKFHDFSSKYTCNATVGLTGLSDTLEAVTGIHEKKKSNDDVRGLAVTNQNIGVFPKNIINFFPNIVMIKFTNTGFTSLSGSDLTPFPNLVALHVANNNIERLSNNLLVSNSKLKTFVFENNNMKHIGAKLVNRFATLRILKLNGNTCVSGEANNDSTDLSNLLYQIAVDCAPTFETMESDLLDSPTFLAAIDARIEAQVETCVKTDDFSATIGSIQSCLPDCTIEL